MSAELVVYSIQRTYIINPVSKSEKRILTCDQRIDIPTIEPLPSVEPVSYDRQPLTVIPCIELAGEFLSEFNLTLETNEGVTVLPVKIYPFSTDAEDLEEMHPYENPYTHFRYVLVLPRGATGVKSCKLIHKATGKEVQHNFTFGIMPPPYNYDNALFGVISTFVYLHSYEITHLNQQLAGLRLRVKSPAFVPIELRKGAGKRTIHIMNDVLFYETVFNYHLSTEAATHNPKITLNGGGRDFVYTLSLDRTLTAVSIDLLTGMITVYDGDTGEILKQFKLAIPYNGFETLSFENFDDIDYNVLRVTPKGARVLGDYVI